ncbi:hypothetical protein QAD02_001275 [Eretmocerus hayati]|uniref:Uncharacterized protein n=1 Tax=Eretmocerus hayati TaxID=131215 RepID=A0ACC2NHB1_9HYME|nr:hypothetical protein QAD02_001275 [Eretmocerus hayati]
MLQDYGKICYSISKADTSRRDGNTDSPYFIGASIIMITFVAGQFINEFSPDGGFTYKSIYASPINANLTKIELQDHADTAVGMLVGLSVFTKIFDERHDPRSMKTLMKDQTAISVGALLMQLDIMMGKGPNSFKLIDPTDLDAGYRDHNAIPEYERCQIEGSSLHSLTLMGLFGCIPNIKTGFTRDRLFITHSLQPIKKGDKLIIFNISSSVFNYIPTTTRQFFHQKIYNCPCDCQACTENWCMDDLRRRGVERVVYNQFVFFGMVNELNLLIEAKKANSRSYINPDKKAVAKVTDLLVRAWKHCEMPSTVITRAVRTFVETVGYFHGESRYDWI